MLLSEGLLWFDNSPRRSFADKVQDGALAYERRFKRRPTLCLVHPGDLPGDLEAVAGLRVEGAPTVLRHHFLLGVRRRAG
jgi:hypothetical protein